MIFSSSLISQRIMSSGDEVNTHGMQNLVCTVYNVIIVQSCYFCFLKTIITGAHAIVNIVVLKGPFKLCL